MSKNITITEKQFKSLMESVSEVSYDTVWNAANKTDDVDFSGVKDAIYNLREALEVYYRSFSPLHGRAALGYYMEKGKAPAEGSATKFLGYLDEMENYFNRKEEQSRNFYDTSNRMQEDNDKRLYDIALKMGFKGNDFMDIWQHMSSEQYEQFMEQLPPDLRQYVENHW